MYVNGEAKNAREQLGFSNFRTSLHRNLRMIFPVLATDVFDKKRRLCFDIRAKMHECIRFTSTPFIAWTFPHAY
ncbi:hypothetical protein Lal_00027461 [Lupinus albus]|nr:hypothetical protein Lal_00027461 [Lupinus albus]